MSVRANKIANTPTLSDVNLCTLSVTYSRHEGGSAERLARTMRPCYSYESYINYILVNHILGN